MSGGNYANPADPIGMQRGRKDNIRGFESAFIHFETLLHQEEKTHLIVRQRFLQM